MSRTIEKFLDKAWRVLATVSLIAALPFGLVLWTQLYNIWFRVVFQDLYRYNVPDWVGVTLDLLWFFLPLVGVVWLLLKIWKRRPPRITQGKG